MAIPKIIHFIWFGGNPLPKLEKKCVKSWKKYCPGYQIMQWDESTFDLSTAPQYVRQAYNNKKWAFVSDYVRLWALFNYGGVYLDTDVQMLKPIDRFLSERAFSGFETVCCIQTGVMAAEKGHETFKLWMDEYNTKQFVLEDGSLNLETNVTAITRLMLQNGLLLNNHTQTIAGVTFYPNDYFCPKNFETGVINYTDNTYCIHHFNASWWTSEQKSAYRYYLKKQRIAKKYGSHIGKIYENFHYAQKVNGGNGLPNYFIDILFRRLTRKGK